MKEMKICMNLLCLYQSASCKTNNIYFVLKNRFYIIEKSTGKVLPIKYRSKVPFFLFHHINTYEDNGEVKYLRKNL